MKQIKRKVNQVPLLTFLERRLQIREVASPFMVECHKLSIKDAAFYLQLRGSLRKASHAVRPIQSRARERGYLRAVLAWNHADLDAVSIKLQLMNPVIARRSPPSLLGELRRNEAGNRFERRSLQKALDLLLLLRGGFGYLRSGPWLVVLPTQQKSLLRIPYMVPAFRDLLHRSLRDRAMGRYVRDPF